MAFMAIAQWREPSGPARVGQVDKATAQRSMLDAKTIDSPCRQGIWPGEQRRRRHGELYVVHSPIGAYCRWYAWVHTDGAYGTGYALHLCLYIGRRRPCPQALVFP
jgi:hypothetical protein